MNRVRLEHAIRVMEDVRDRQLPFNIKRWCESADHPDDCGTAACFIGWLCRDPWFKREGLKWSSGGRVAGSKVPSFHDGRSCLAASYLFDISITAADMLVYSEHYPYDHLTPEHVLERLYYLRDYGERDFHNYFYCMKSA